MKAKEIFENLLAEASVRKEQTCDRLVSGDENKEVAKIAVCFKLTAEVLARAIESGADMLITHEPVFSAGYYDGKPGEFDLKKEEVMKLLQSETDKKVTQALKTQAKKYEREMSLSKLDDNAREKAEKDNRIAELEEQLKAFEIEKNKSELKSVLAARGLSAVFADIIKVTDNLEESQANIDKLDKEFKAAVTAEVEKRLAGNRRRLQPCHCG